MKMDRKHLMIIGGIAVLVVLYMYYRNSSSGSSSSSAQLPSSSGTDSTGYSDLATQEGSDVAALSGQEASDVAALSSQEQTDFGNLGSTISGVYQQEQQDVQGLAGQESTDFNTVSGNVSQLTAANQKLTTRLGNVVKTLNRDASKIRNQQRQIVKLQKGKATTKTTGTHNRSNGTSKGARTGHSAVGHANPGHVTRPTHAPRRHPHR